MGPVSLFLEWHHRTSRIPHGRRVAASVSGLMGHVDSMLDVGCGDGVNTKRLGETVGAKRITGIDVKIRSAPVIEVVPYDGLHIPFPDASFDAVSIIDVLHHCGDPQTVLNEAVRVAKKMVVLKDHVSFGPVTTKLLYWSDLVGNAKDAIPCPGIYWNPRQWVEMIARAGARVEALDWPLKLHDMPWRIVGWPQLQFAARLVPVR